MKLNTSLFICLFFSAIIAIKAEEYVTGYNEYSTTENYIDESSTEEQYEEQDQNVQEVARDQLPEPQEATFQYKPSKRVEEIENNMPDSAKEFVADGKVKETMTDTYANAMATDVAKNGFSDVNHQWQLMLEGPEASRVVGTFGQNFNTVFSSPDGADMINMLATTAHVLLAKAGEHTMHSGLSDIMSMTYSLFSSPNMPDIVNMTGGLVITAVNKPNAALFTKTFWTENKKLLSVNNLNEKLSKYFNNLMSMMKSLNGMMQDGRQLRRARTTVM